MRVGISMEMTRALRDTWHAALNHEWYAFFEGHEIVPMCCHDKTCSVEGLDLVVLAGGNDMPGIKTWRDNHYPLRDEYEKKLIETCWDNSLPVVGICRGSHFINHISGGTHVLMDQPYDNVKVQLPKFEVTCHHSIMIDKVAPGFEILQQDSFGVKELTLNKLTRMLCVGWHPERNVNQHTRQYILDLIKDL